MITQKSYLMGWYTSDPPMLRPCSCVVAWAPEPRVMTSGHWPQPPERSSVTRVAAPAPTDRRLSPLHNNTTSLARAPRVKLTQVSKIFSSIFYHSFIYSISFNLITVGVLIFLYLNFYILTPGPCVFGFALDNTMACLQGSQAQDVSKKVTNYVAVTLYFTSMSSFLSSPSCFIMTFASLYLGLKLILN